MRACAHAHCAKPQLCAMFGAREKEAEVDSTIILAATAGAFLLAGFVKGVIGLGLPTVSIGLLGLLGNVKF